MATILKLTLGDITKIKVDAIVNSANEYLSGGGGVDQAIHTAAGPELAAECENLEYCEIGDAKMTHGYNLPAKFVIHAVGPVWHEGLDQEWLSLSSAYQRSLEIAMEKSLRTIAFPSISTGAYGYPITEAAPIALSTIEDVVDENPEAFEKIILVLYTPEDFRIYQKFAHDKWVIDQQVIKS